MKKSLIKIVTALFTVALATSSFAGKGGAKERPTMGKVTAVADGTITISNKRTGDKTFKTSSDTTYAKADGTTGAATDIKVGSMVKVTAGATPDAAASIALFEHKKKDAAAGGGTAPATGSESKPTPAAEQ